MFGSKFATLHGVDYLEFQKFGYIYEIADAYNPIEKILLIGLIFWIYKAYCYQYVFHSIKDTKQIYSEPEITSTESISCHFKSLFKFLDWHMFSPNFEENFTKIESNLFQHLNH